MKFTSNNLARQNVITNMELKSILLRLLLLLAIFHWWILYLFTSDCSAVLASAECGAAKAANAFTDRLLCGTYLKYYGLLF